MSPRQANDFAERRSAAPLPLAGRGWGWGSGRASSAVEKRTATPTPCPSPQGGGETSDQQRVCPQTIEDLRFRALLPRDAWDSLPAPVRRRFSKRLGLGQTAIYVGTIVEMDASPVGTLLAQVARLIGGPLPLKADVGTASVVSVTEDGGSGGQVWTRLYAARTGFPQIIHSAKRFAGPSGLEEYVGRGIGMALDVSVEGRALVFHSRHFFLQLGRRRLRLPDWLGPGRVRVAHEDLGGGAFRFTLDVARRRIGLHIRQVGLYRDA